MWACLGGQVSGGDHVGVRWTHGVASVTENVREGSGHGEQGRARHGLLFPLLHLARGRVWQVQGCARKGCDMVLEFGKGDIELVQRVAKLARAWHILAWPELLLYPL